MEHYVITLTTKGSDYGEVIQLQECQSFYHTPTHGPCNWDVLVTDKGIFYRPDTYYYKSPYGWRRLFY